MKRFSYILLVLVSFLGSLLAPVVTEKYLGNENLGVAINGRFVQLDSSTGKLFSDVIPELGPIYTPYIPIPLADTSFSSITATGTISGAQYTAPYSGYKGMVVGFQVMMNSGTGLTPGALSIGTNSTAYDNIVGITSMTDLTDSGEATFLLPKAGYTYLNNGDIIYYKKTTAWSGSGNIKITPIVISVPGT